MSIRNKLLEMLTVAMPENISKGMRAINTQNYTESNIKLGRQHEWSVLVIGLASGASNDTIFITGNGGVILKSRRVGYTGSGINAFIYEGPTYTGGVQSETQNPNAINPMATLSQIFTGAAVSATGNLIFSPEYSIGINSQQAKGSSSREIGQEKVLKPNTAYLFRLTSVDNQIEDVTTALSWYEGPIDLPRP